MKKWMIVLLFAGMLLTLTACTTLLGGNGMTGAPAPSQPPAEEAAEEEPGDMPEATQMPMPTVTALPDTGGGSEATPAPTPEPETVYIDLNTVYAEVVEGLPEGSALFNPSETMQLGKVHLVEVRVVPVSEEDLEEDEGVIATLTVGMEDDRPVVVIPLKVSTVMSARLTGEGFSIKDLKKEEQIRTESQPYLSWVWEVRPDKTGEQHLTLHLSVVVNAEGMGDKSYTTSEVRTVDVSGNFWYAVSRFLGSNWEWVLTGVLLPFLGWGGRKVWGLIAGE